MTALVERLVPMRVGAAEMLVAAEGDRLRDIYESHCWYEQDLLHAIRDRQRGGTFVDVGASHGNHTVFFAVECHAERVIAIEPYPGELEILAANIAHNGIEAIARVVPALVHPTWRSATLTAATEHGLPEMWCYSDQAVLSEGGDTPCVTLDEVLAGEHVDVLKIDVEDTSPAVLGTGLATITRCRPLIAIEAEPTEQAKIARLLTPLGYQCEGCFCWTPTYLWSPR